MRHPLHPMLVHFPLACWSIATVVDLAATHYSEGAWRLAATLLVIGVVMALPTIVTGIIELIQVPDEPKVMRDAYLHMGVMMLAFALYVASLLMRVEAGHFIAPGKAAIIVSVCGLATLLIGAWLGGSLVYGYGVGRRHPDD